MIVQHGFCWSAFPLREVNGAELADRVGQIKEILKTVICDPRKKAGLKVSLDKLA
jgi:hypothetical protein